MPQNISAEECQPPAAASPPLAAAKQAAPEVTRQESAKKAGSPLQWLLRLAAGGLVLTWLAWKHGAALGHALRAVSPLVLAGSIVFYLAGQVVSAWKWRSLLGALGAPISLWTCCRLYWLGMFWNLWMPTNIGGDALRVYLMVREAPQLGTGRATASVFIERITGLLALLLIGAVALPLDVQHGGLTETGRARDIFALAAILFLLLGAALVLMLRSKTVPAPLRPLLLKLRAAFGAFEGREGKQALWIACGLSLIFQGSQVLLNVALARSVGLPVSALTVCWVTPALALASLLPLGIGGLGVREAAAIGLLSGASLGGHGLQKGAIVAWSLLWQATVWLSSAPGGLWSLGRKRP